MHAKSVLKDCYFFISKYWLQLFLLTLPVSLLWHACNFFVGLALDDMQELFAFLLLNVIMFSLVEIIVITYARRLSEGGNLSPGSIYFAAFHYWLPMMQLSLIKLLAVGLGLMLFIIPGVFIAIRLALAEQHMVLRGANLSDAFRTSINLTAPHFVLLLTVLGYLFLLHFFYQYLSAQASDALHIVLFPFGVLIASFSTIAAYRIYALLNPPQKNDAV